MTTDTYANAPDNISAPRYHWTPASQRAFLAHLAVEGSVRLAAAHVSMSPRAAYDLRYRSEGMAFRMGWAAAILIARDRLSDDVMERAMHPVIDTYSRSAPDGDGAVHITRERHDNRLAMACLARLDRMHEQASLDTDDRFFAKAISHSWGAYLDLIGTDEAQAGANNVIIARYLVAAMERCNPFAAVWSDGDFEREVAQISDGLEDQDRAQVAAEEAARKSAPSAPLTAQEQATEMAAEMEVWYCSAQNAWRTNFPPTDDFDGEEECPFGEDGYERALSDAELAIKQAALDTMTAPLRAAGETARQAWFGQVAQLA